MEKIEMDTEHKGFPFRHVVYDEAAGDKSANIVKLGYNLCSCGHLHPWAIGECGFGVDCEKGYCETCKTYRPLVVQNERLVMDCSNCEICRLLACIH